MKNYLFEISVEDKAQLDRVIKRMVILGLKKDRYFFSRKIDNPIGLMDKIKSSVHIVRASAEESEVSKFLSVPSVKNFYCLSEHIPFK